MTDTTQDDIFGGALPDTTDDRDFIAGDISPISAIPESELPKVSRFPHGAATLESQGSTVSCTAQAATNALEIEYFRATGKIVKVSADVLDLVGGMAAKIDGLAQYDRQKEWPATAGTNGDYVRSALRALVYWSKKLVGIPAIVKATGEEVRIKVDSFAQIAKDAIEFRRYLSVGKPIITSCNVTKNASGVSNFSVAKKTGVLRISGARVGGHAWFIGGADFSGENDPIGNVKNFFRWGQSYGEAYGPYKNGTMLLPSDEVKNLDTPWVIFIEESDLKPRIFLDVAADDFAAAEIKEALEDEILLGEDSATIPNPQDRKFYPNRALSRREMAIVYSRMKKALQRALVQK